MTCATGRLETYSVCDRFNSFDINTNKTCTIKRITTFDICGIRCVIRRPSRTWFELKILLRNSLRLLHSSDTVDFMQWVLDENATLTARGVADRKWHHYSTLRLRFPICLVNWHLSRMSIAQCSALPRAYMHVIKNWNTSRSIDTPSSNEKHMLRATFWTKDGFCR